MPALLNAETVQRLLNEVPDWSFAENQVERTFQFPDFAAAIAFVNKVAQIAEDMNHHPDIDVRWNKVRLSVSTHSAGGLTHLDFQLAQRVNQLC